MKKKELFLFLSLESSPDVGEFRMRQSAVFQRGALCHGVIRPLALSALFSLICSGIHTHPHRYTKDTHFLRMITRSSFIAIRITDMKSA